MADRTRGNARRGARDGARDGATVGARVGERPKPCDGSWLCNLLCLWRFCDKRACQRGRACRGSPGHCLHFMSLVPLEARKFIFGWDDAREAGLSFDEMIEENAEEWEMLMNWRALVFSTLPEHRDYDG